MADAAISVQGVYKKFRRGEQFDSVRDLVAARLLRRRPAAALRRAEFWALRDVSFDVRPGESLGIIGPNGAGKSTMLKILAGIMRPDRGRARVQGPVSPLIELGAGFHGDLTGRENIYLNASILGMSRRTVVRRFDEIVEFAGIGDFLDTPVKRYSSGMYARLGFSIAAHAEPRTLLVDEVLSVGDRVFRSRCMDRMRAFLKQGVAVVFVSHDLGAVTKFCDRTLVLTKGSPLSCGSTAEAVQQYYAACAEPTDLEDSKSAAGAVVSDIRLVGASGEPVSSVQPGERVRFQFQVAFDTDLFRRRKPDTTVRLQVLNTGMVEERVSTRDADFGIVGGQLTRAHLVVEPWREDELLLIVPPTHPFAGRRTVRARDLAGENLLSRERGSATRATYEAAFLRAGVALPRGNPVGSTEAIKQAVAAGMGVGIVSRFSVAAELRAGTLRAARIRGVPLIRPLFILRSPKALLRDAALEFLDFLRTTSLRKRVQTAGAGERIRDQRG